MKSGVRVPHRLLIVKNPRKQRLLLYREAEGRCHYCNVKTVLPKVKNEIDGELNMATIDHLYSRSDPRRYDPPKDQPRHVLACWKCNQIRSRFEDARNNLVCGKWSVRYK